MAYHYFFVLSPLASCLAYTVLTHPLELRRAGIRMHSFGSWMLLTSFFYVSSGLAAAVFFFAFSQIGHQPDPARRHRVFAVSFIVIHRGTYLGGARWLLSSTPASDV